jgi:hypothetical protein
MEMNDTDAVAQEIADSVTRIPKMAVDEMREAWRHAVRCYSVCDNAELHHSRQALAEVVAKISQQLEYFETMTEPR